MRRKKVFWFALVVVILISIVIFTCDSIIHNAAKGKLYADSKSIPYNKLGILLGVPKFKKNGDKSMYYDNRVAAAVKLLQDRKIKYLLISGDSSSERFNEPYSMRGDLIASGIDSSVLYVDYLCTRTYESIRRLKEIYGQDTVTIISQAPHNERALYLASKEGIQAIAFNAVELKGVQTWYTTVHEKLARVKVFIGFLFDKNPVYSDPKVKLPDN